MPICRIRLEYLFAPIEIHELIHKIHWIDGKMDGRAARYDSALAQAATTNAFSFTLLLMAVAMQTSSINVQQIQYCMHSHFNIIGHCIIGICIRGRMNVQKV